VAFGRLVERHHGTLVAILRQRFGPRAPVEDLVQETLSRTLASLDGFRGEASFLTWAASIALNLATDGARRDLRRRRLAPVAPLDRADGVPGREPCPADAAGERDEARRARAALDRLPAAQRLAVTLRVVESLGYNEVARRLGVREDLARQWVSRGVRALREELRASGAEVRHA
jgi:RNA polymerase sigma-70 factor (ECF subfamily)